MWTSLDDGSCHPFVYSLRHFVGLLGPFSVLFDHLLFLSSSPWVSLPPLWLPGHPKYSYTSAPLRAFLPSSWGDSLPRRPRIPWTSIWPWRLLATYHLLCLPPKFLGWNMLHRISRFPSLLAWWWANGQLAFLDAAHQRSDEGRNYLATRSCQWKMLVIWWTIPWLPLRVVGKE